MAQNNMQTYHRAWTSGDLETVMSCVSDDVFCRAPGVDLKGKKEYREFIRGFFPKLTGIDDARRYDELLLRQDGVQATMGRGRSMRPGWIEISAEALDGAKLSSWTEITLDYNGSVSKGGV